MKIDCYAFLSHHFNRTVLFITSHQFGSSGKREREFVVGTGSPWLCPHGSHILPLSPGSKQGICKPLPPLEEQIWIRYFRDNYVVLPKHDDDLYGPCDILEKVYPKAEKPIIFMAYSSASGVTRNDCNPRTERYSARLKLCISKAFQIFFK